MHCTLYFVMWIYIKQIVTLSFFGLLFAADSNSPSSLQTPYLSFQNRDITIPVAFHNIYSPNGNVGYMSEEKILDILDLMNVAFNPWGISFSLYGIDYLGNEFIWFLDASGSYMVDMGIAPNTVMNIYISRGYYTETITPQDDFGYATYPWTYPPTDREMDGIVVNYQIFGGQEEGTWDYDQYFRYNQGDWLIRLIGKYFGLFKTYEFGCNYGDLVDDTPKQNNGLGIGVFNAHTLLIGFDNILKQLL